MTRKLIYLDNNATTAMDPQVLEAMLPYLNDLAGNPSSTHQVGRRARQAIDRAKLSLAEDLDCSPEEIVFTSGATESNNLAIHSARLSEKSHVLLNPSEHPSCMEPTAALEKQGITVTRLSLDAEGTINQAAMPIDDDLSCVVIQLANSETGVIQPIAEIRNRLPTDCWLHVDAVQGVGKIPVSFRELGATTLSLSAHKIHGPTGIGALVVKEGYRIRSWVKGGHQQRGARPGTEPVALIVGLAAAVRLAVTDQTEHATYMADLRDLLEKELTTRVGNLLINGGAASRIPNTTNLSFLGVRAESAVIALDLAGIACSAGSACASGSMEPSPVLRAMGFTGERLEGGIRFCVSRMTPKEDVIEACARMADVVKRLRNKSKLSDENESKIEPDGCAI